jgi:hypothetical protein
VLLLGVLFLAIGTIDASPRTQLDELIARAKSLELDTPYVPPPGDPLLHHGRATRSAAGVIGRG